MIGLTSYATLPPDEVRLIKAYLKERTVNSPYVFLSTWGLPISRRQLDTLMKQYAHKAKLPPDKQHFHILKHSIAIHLLAAAPERTNVPPPRL